MRIIAGALGGRTLAIPSDERTRPMLEKTRGAVFNMLGERIVGRRVLDLFAGTGSLGLEALSRGAARATFVERDPVARRCLEKNVDTLGLAERCWVTGSAVERAVSRMGEGEFDLVFLDPPYALAEGDRERAELLQLFRELWGSVLAVDGILVFHFPTRSLGMQHFAPAEPLTVREYGRNSVALFEKIDA